jgi:peptidyl-prolyl cis-trans isomerase C
MQGQIKDEVIAREIFMQEAQKRGLDTSTTSRPDGTGPPDHPDPRAVPDFQKKDPVTDAEIKAEYDKFVAANGGKEYKASHILVEKEDEAKAIIASLKKGGKFEDIAKKQSKDPGSGAKVASLDWANPGSYVPEFTAAMVKLEKGKTTEVPVKSQFGLARDPPGRRARSQLPKLEEVKPQIAQQMQQQKLAKFQDDLRAKANAMPHHMTPSQGSSGT